MFLTMHAYHIHHVHGWCALGLYILTQVADAFISFTILPFGTDSALDVYQTLTPLTAGVAYMRVFIFC